MLIPTFLHHSFYLYSEGGSEVNFPIEIEQAVSEEEEERVAIDCFPLSLLRYDDLLTYVVEEVAEVASVVEAR